jgi:hypothetical protein
MDIPAAPKIKFARHVLILCNEAHGYVCRIFQDINKHIHSKRPEEDEKGTNKEKSFRFAGGSLCVVCVLVSDTLRKARMRKSKEANIRRKAQVCGRGGSFLL